MADFFNRFFANLGILDPLYYLYIVPAILLSLSVHECAHAYTANYMGDPTAKNAGRLTLNPLKHIDILGFIAFIFLRFGWAKPVPVQPMYFKNPRKGMAAVAAAGPISNLCLAIINILLYCIYGTMEVKLGFNQAVSSNVLEFLCIMAQINITLALFNLIPVAPLDGGRILDPVLPVKVSSFIHRNEYIISIVLFAVLLMSSTAAKLISFLQSGLFYALYRFFSIPFTVFFGVNFQ